MFYFVFSDSFVADGVGPEQSTHGSFWGVRAAECAKLLSREAKPCCRQHNVMDTCPEIKITSTPPPIES